MQLRARQLQENTSGFFGLLLPCRDADTDDIDVPDRRLRGASPQYEASLSWLGKSAMSMDMTSSDVVRGPNMAWFANITYVKTRQGWLYLSLVMDIWSWRIAGWSMGPNITAELADEALRMALARRNLPEGCVRHSDHGSQYVSLLLSKTMRENDVRP